MSFPIKVHDFGVSCKEDFLGSLSDLVVYTNIPIGLEDYRRMVTLGRAYVVMSRNVGGRLVMSFPIKVHDFGVSCRDDFLHSLIDISFGLKKKLLK